MSVISKISVGDIFYYQVDDIPTHIAPKGSVAIMSTSNYVNGDGFIYVNNDSATTWLKCISPSWASVSLTNGTNGTDFDTLTLGSWYAFNSVPSTGSWILNTNSNEDWILTTEGTGNDDLKYTGSSSEFRAHVSQSSTIRGGESRWVDFETGVSLNFTVPLNWQEARTNSISDTTCIESQHFIEMGTNDFILGAISPISRESGGGGAATRTFIPRHQQVTAIKVDEPLVASLTTIISEDWESNSFTANSWTVVNDTTNQWEIGTAQVDTGTYGAYGSNDGGTTANYSEVGDVSHFYKDFILPADTNITLTFVWRSFMENAGAATEYDYGSINIVATGTTPVAGTEIATSLATTGGNGRLNQTGDNDGKFNEGYRYGGVYDGTWFTETIDLTAYAGENKRIIFTFKDDGVAPQDAPAMSIDNISLIYGGETIY